MRIMLVTEPSGGGSGRHVVDLARALKKRGHDVCLVYSPTRAEARFEAETRALGLSKLERLPMSRAITPADIKSTLALRRLIRRHGPFDVVHAHSSKAGALLRAAAPRDAARVYTPHAFRTMDPSLGKGGRFIYGMIEAILARLLSDAIIAVAPEEEAHARNEAGIPASKLHTVLNGIDAVAAVDREAVRAELGLAPTDIAVGFVGRLAEQKDPLKFVRAVHAANNRDSRFKGVMLGDGEMTEAARVEAGNVVTILSGRNAREYLPAFDVFAMTSRYEAMPYVLLEALEAGLPIVATAVGGTSATVAPGKNGIVVPVAATPEFFAEALVQLAPADRRASMSGHSRELASRFSIEAMVDATEAVYRAAVLRRLGSKPFSRAPL